MPITDNHELHIFIPGYEFTNLGHIPTPHEEVPFTVFLCFHLLALLILAAIYAIIESVSQNIVVDTSVIVSALIGKRGASREVLRRCLAGDYNPLISNALFQEYEDVTARNRIRNTSPLNEKEIRELLNAFYSVCRWVPVYFLWRPNLKDEHDNFLVELAIAGNSNVIVTNNINDLEGAELTFDELKILKPEQLLRGD